MKLVREVRDDEAKNYAFHRIMHFIVNYSRGNIGAHIILEYVYPASSAAIVEGKSYGVDID